MLKDLLNDTYLQDNRGIEKEWLSSEDMLFECTQDENNLSLIVEVKFPNISENDIIIGKILEETLLKSLFELNYYRNNGGIVLPNLTWTEEFYTNERVTPKTPSKSIESIDSSMISITPERRILDNPSREQIVLYIFFAANGVLSYGGFTRDYIKDAEGLKPLKETDPI